MLLDIDALFKSLDSLFLSSNDYQFSQIYILPVG